MNVQRFKSFRRLAALFIAGAILAACSPDAPATVAVTQADNSSATARASETSTSTLEPSATPIVIPTATATPTPTTEVQPEPTQDQPDLTENEIIAAILSASAPEVVQQSPTAGNTFIVEVVRYECSSVPGMGEQQMAYELLLVTPKDGTQFEVARQLQYCGGLGAFGFNGRFWTTDDRYFYFDEAREGVPDGAPCGVWNPGVSRIDTQEMVVERLPGAGPQTGDGKKMVLWVQPDFVLWDTLGGEMARSEAPVDDYYLYSAEISPSGKRMLYVMRGECFNPAAKSIIALLDLETMANTILVEAEPNGYVHAAWDSESTAILQDPDGNKFLLNLSTGTITPQK